MKHTERERSREERRHSPIVRKESPKVREVPPAVKKIVKPTLPSLPPVKQEKKTWKNDRYDGPATQSRDHYNSNNYEQQRIRKEERFQVIVKGLPSSYSKPSQVTDLISSDIEVISTRIENGSGSAELLFRDKQDAVRTLNMINKTCLQGKYLTARLIGDNNYENSPRKVKPTTREENVSGYEYNEFGQR